MAGHYVWALSKLYNHAKDTSFVQCLKHISPLSVKKKQKKDLTIHRQFPHASKKVIENDVRI